MRKVVTDEEIVATKMYETYLKIKGSLVIKIRNSFY